MKMSRDLILLLGVAITICLVAAAAKSIEPTTADPSRNVAERPIKKTAVRVPSRKVRTPTRSTQHVQSTIIVYRPPPGLSAPTGRVGGGPRAATGATARVEVLGPAHAGQTIQSQPTLYWYVSEAVNTDVDLFLSSADDREALLDITLEPPIKAGVHRVALADHGVHLIEGQRYKFHVFLHSVGDGPQSTAGIALVERVAAPGHPGHSDNDAIARAKAFARDGLWYDAFDAVSTSIEQGADMSRAKEIRAQLLDQVGLASVAEHERE